MKSINIAILGCGTVGGGVARIITEMNAELNTRSGCNLNLKKIVEIAPKTAAERFNLPLQLFCGNGNDLTKEQANQYIQEIIDAKDIDLVIETIGGSSDFIFNIAMKVCQAKKHFVTANKALLAKRGKEIFEAATQNNVIVGYEASVCGAIPIIKTIKESFTGDVIESISGIMNGTSNYILSMMQNENLAFKDALRLAQENGYAESDPTLDINGHDAGHKLIILLKLAFGMNLPVEKLSINGIENISKDDIEFAKEIGCKIKLICYAQKIDNKIYATVCPMMVKPSSMLADINGATNAVRLMNKYSGKHVLVGSGAGSLETASSIVADIVYIARYANQILPDAFNNQLEFADAKNFKFPYIVSFETEDMPGTTGLITTCIGNQKINIDTVSHNRHNEEKAIFSLATMPCTLHQIEDAIQEIKKINPKLLINEPKITPILN